MRGAGSGLLVCRTDFRAMLMNHRRVNLQVCPGVCYWTHAAHAANHQQLCMLYAATKVGAKHLDTQESRHPSSLCPLNSPSHVGLQMICYVCVSRASGF